MILTWAGKAGFSTPASLANLAAWFRKGVGQTDAGGGACSAWADQSGNGRNLAQGTGANQPLIQGDGALLFDGTNSFMKCTGFTLNQPETIYLLFKQITWTSGDCLFEGNASGSGRVAQTGSSPNLRASSDAGITFIDSSPDLALDTYGVLTVVFNGASSQIRINSNAAVSGDAAANNMAGFNLGSRTSTSNAANIQVKEIAIYSAAHDTATQDLVIAYMNAV